VGARLPWSDSATDAVCGLEGDGPAALIATGRSTTPTAAALLNSSYIQGFELDDYHPVAPVHSACLVLPASLSAACALGGSVSGRDLLLGAIRGFEVGPRVGFALHGAQMLTRGWHSGPVFGGPAAAAAADERVRILAVDRDQHLIGPLRRLVVAGQGAVGHGPVRSGSVWLGSAWQGVV